MRQLYHQLLLLIIDHNLAVTSFEAPTSSAGSPITGTTSIFRLIFDRSIADDQLDSDDFSPSISGPVIDSVAPFMSMSDMTATYDVTVINPSGSSGTYTVHLRASAVDGGTTYKSGPSAQYTSTDVHYDTTPVVSGAAWTNVSFCTTSGKLQGTMTFSNADVEGISASDFEVINNAGDDQRWVFDPTSSSATAGTGILIQATAPANTNGDFRLKLKANHVRSGGSSTSNSPSVDVISSPATSIDIRERVRVSSFTAPRETQTGTTANLTLTFDRRIPATELSSGDFTATNGAAFSSINPTTGNSSSFAVTITQPTNGTGTYTVTLAANSVSAGTDYRSGPAAARTSFPVTYDTLPSKTSADITVPLPTESMGAIQLSLKQRSFNVRGNPMQVGPEFRQYLGTVFYNTKTEFAPVARFDLPDGIQDSEKSDIDITFVGSENPVLTNKVRVHGLQPI